MAINIVNTQEDAQNFPYFGNQSTILFTNETKNINLNGVNVFVDRPKKGDVMCVTRYKDESGNLLTADEQKVKWIDGLSINPTQLSQEIEPVGICVAINGNKAMVRYREEKWLRFTNADRWELTINSTMTDGVEHSLAVSISNQTVSEPFVYTASTIAEFVEKLNAWLRETAPNYSAERVKSNTDLPSDTGNRIVVSARFATSDNSWKSLSIQGITSSRIIAKHIPIGKSYMRKNGFVGVRSGCCYAKYYDYFSNSGGTPSSEMKSINTATPIKKAAFTNNNNCKILRDNFSSYAEYIDSMIVKFPCSIYSFGDLPSGKENTYNLADCTFLNNITRTNDPLYAGAYWASQIDENAPKLGKGNWWLPSPAEIAQMMRDITYGTSFWDTNPDIVNRVISKLTSVNNSGWSLRPATSSLYTPSRYSNSSAIIYYGGNGAFDSYSTFSYIWTPAITIYEF